VATVENVLDLLRVWDRYRRSWFPSIHLVASNTSGKAMTGTPGTCWWGDTTDDNNATPE
jgi:hypothetical protein